jgi:hypothetical protein
VQPLRSGCKFFDILRAPEASAQSNPRIFSICGYRLKNFLQEKAVEATKQEKQRKEEKTDLYEASVAGS